MRIAIVNDSAAAVEALRRVVLTRPPCEIAWIAHSGAEAVAQCAADTPDLVLMDLMMPGMDGVEATRRIMKESPCAILVVTATVSGNTDAVFEAMGHGALDAVDTPVLDADSRIVGGALLLAKINTIAKLLGKGPRRVERAEVKSPRGDIAPLVGIGASTGGPGALSDILSRLPARFGAAIVIVQHVDQRFASGMADWLGSRCPLPVHMIAGGEKPEPGVVSLAGTNDHLVLRPDLSLAYTPHPAKSPYRPSVDVFFESVAAHWPSKDTGVLLTGMGRDGAEGLLALRQAGWHTISQDEASSVVYGMPKAAAELEAAVEIGSPSKIAQTLTRMYRT